MLERDGGGIRRDDLQIGAARQGFAHAQARADAARRGRVGGGAHHLGRTRGGPQRGDGVGRPPGVPQRDAQGEPREEHAGDHTNVCSHDVEGDATRKSPRGAAIA